MKLMTNLIVLPLIFCLIGCPMACSPVAPDDDDDDDVMPATMMMTAPPATTMTTVQQR